MKAVNERNSFDWVVYFGDKGETKRTSGRQPLCLACRSQ